jgi:glutathionyl-hydroquinone reductase
MFEASRSGKGAVMKMNSETWADFIGRATKEQIAKYNVKVYNEIFDHGYSCGQASAAEEMRGKIVHKRSEP